MNTNEINRQAENFVKFVNLGRDTELAFDCCYDMVYDMIGKEAFLDLCQAAVKNHTVTEKDVLARFGEETMKMFKSCKYAYANVEYGNIWGDFTNKKQAVQAARMWMIAFKTNKVELKVEGSAYRVAVMF